MKKLINDPNRVVEEMLEGLVAIYPGLRRLSGESVIVRADADLVRDRRVGLISGGGSGHEPAHAGYIGRGMLSAAVAGDVFTSPGPDAVYAAIQAVASSRGALLIVKNYTGDRLNFGLAAERAEPTGFRSKWWWWLTTLHWLAAAGTRAVAASPARSWSTNLPALWLNSARALPMSPPWPEARPPP